MADVERRPTGLLKKCPRCGRVGEIFIMDLGGGSLSLEIVWEAHGDRAVGRDWSVVVEDILNPNMGCGYDSSSAYKNSHA